MSFQLQWEVAPGAEEGTRLLQFCLNWRLSLRGRTLPGHEESAWEWPGEAEWLSLSRLKDRGLMSLEDLECPQGLQAAGRMIVIRDQWMWINELYLKKKKVALVRSGYIAKAGRQLLFCEVSWIFGLIPGRTYFFFLTISMFDVS